MLKVALQHHEEALRAPLDCLIFIEAPGLVDVAEHNARDVLVLEHWTDPRKENAQLDHHVGKLSELLGREIVDVAAVFVAKGHREVVLASIVDVLGYLGLRKCPLMFT